MTTTDLQATYSVRAPTLADADEITALVQAAEIAETGEPEMEREILVDDWNKLNLETDAWVVLDGDGDAGRIVGYGELTDRGHVQFNSWAATHPEHVGRGIGSLLVSRIEERARRRVEEAPEGARVTLHNYVAHVNGAARELLESRGYEPVRRYWRMAIDMTEEPAAPAWPDGIRVRTFERGRDERATFDALEEGFSDHWGFIPGDFDKWVKDTESASFDPTLWFLAVEGDEIAGVSLCSHLSLLPWVDKLAVRRAWRHRGLGLALLQHSFGEFWRRGWRKAVLGVDSENLTGATRLYERAGMAADRQWDRYAKELRPGTELGVSAI